MPPEVVALPLPTSRGVDAKEWLEAHGLIAATPCIRSSDDGFPDDFAFYLRRRLGLVPALQFSEALDRGRWSHERLALLGEDSTTVSAIMNRQLEARLDELKGLCSGLGIIGDSRDKVLERERFDWRTAWSWMDAASEVRVPLPGSRHGTFAEYLLSPSFLSLGVERRGVFRNPLYKRTRLVAQYDRLLYDVKSNRIWIVDYKTCSSSPVDRLQSCPVEFQTWHYLSITENLIRTRVLQDAFDLPSNVALGGMIHIAIQKPTIRFGLEDRDCEAHTHVLKSGPRKGQIEVRHTYGGEPRVENYVARCRAWYLGTGDFSAYRAEREAHPPVNVSITHASAFDDDAREEYAVKIEAIYRLATKDPCPRYFPRSSRGMLAFKGLSPYAPYYVTPVTSWPEITLRGGFIQAHRDDPLPDDSPSSITELS